MTRPALNQDRDDLLFERVAHFVNRAEEREGDVERLVVGNAERRCDRRCERRAIGCNHHERHVALQLDVVERMVAAPSTAAYGRLSVALQARFAMQKLFSVSKGAFRPPPKVESAVVRLAPLPAMLEIDADLLRQAFSARRKQLRNALPDIDFAALGLDPKLRPENLTPQDYARITAFTKSG